ncbi:MAG: iron-sulfur cluster-binding domain-containing protein [Polyangiales bacterium]
MNALIVIPAAVVAVGAAWWLFRPKGAPAPAKKEEHVQHWTVTSVTKETPSTVSFEVDSSLDFQAGQFVLLRPNNELPWRAYSFSRAPGQPLRLTVKRVEGGSVSTYITQRLAAGDKLEVKGPYGHFVLPSGVDHALLLAGGSGITPMLAFMHDLAAKGWPTKVTLVDANRSKEEQILRSEIDELAANSNGKLTVIHVLDDGSEGIKGPMSEDVVSKILESIDAPSLVALCGPTGMMEACHAAVSKRFASAKILEEKFTAVVASVGADAIAHEVEVQENGKSKTFSVREGETVLQASRRAKVNLSSGCESGVCGTCRVKMLRGQIETPEESCLTAEERAEGYALVCIGKVKAPCAFEPKPE